MKSLHSLLALVVLSGCTAQSIETGEEGGESIASEDQALGTTSTPGVAVWTRTQPLITPTIEHVADGSVNFGSGAVSASSATSFMTKFYQ